jgi:hypothetical protein
MNSLKGAKPSVKGRKHALMMAQTCEGEQGSRTMGRTDILGRRSAMSIRGPSIGSSSSIASQIVPDISHLEALEEDLDHDQSAIATSAEVSPCGKFEKLNTRRLELSKLVSTPLGDLLTVYSRGRHRLGRRNRTSRS